METTDEAKRWMTGSFMQRLSTILDYGFAYMYAHSAALEYVNSERNKIRKYEQMQCEYPQHKKILQKRIELTFVEYIRKICLCAFLYMRGHPDTINEFRLIRQVLDEHDEMEQAILSAHRRERSRQAKESSKQQDKSKVKQFTKLSQKLHRLEDKMDELKKSHSSRLVESLREIQRRVDEKVSENTNRDDIEESQGQQQSQNVNGENHDENESDNSSIVKFADVNCAKSSTQNAPRCQHHPIDCCKVIQPIIDKIETTLNSLSAQQQYEESSGSSPEVNPCKSITVTLESQQFSSILPEFKTTKLGSNGCHVELKLNLEC